MSPSIPERHLARNYSWDRVSTRLQFADATHFTSAVFTATLSALTCLVADGRAFQAASADLLCTLSAGAGGCLMPNPGPERPTGVEFLLTGEIIPPAGI